MYTLITSLHQTMRSTNGRDKCLSNSGANLVVSSTFCRQRKHRLKVLRVYGVWACRQTKPPSRVPFVMYYYELCIYTYVHTWSYMYIKLSHVKRFVTGLFSQGRIADLPRFHMFHMFHMPPHATTCRRCIATWRSSARQCGF